MARERGIPVLAPSEDLLWQGEIKGYRVAVTNLRLIVVRGSEIRDVLLQNIYSVELRQSMRLVYLGLLIAFGLPLVLNMVLVMLYGGSGGVVGVEPLSFVIVGLALAVYGWLNRFRLVIRYSGGKMVFKGGGSVHRVMIEFREALLKARPGER